MLTPNNISTLHEGKAFYIEDCMARGQSNATIESKKHHVKTFICWAEKEGVTLVSQLNIHVLEAYRRHIASYRKPKDNQPLSKVSQSHALNAVTLFADRLHYYDILADMSYQKFELPRVNKKLPKTIPDESQIELLMNQPMNKGKIGIRDRAILELYYTAGLRRNELAQLNIRDIDFNAKTVLVRKSKGGNERIVPILNRTISWLNRYLQEVRPSLAEIASGDALFLGATGKRILARALTTLVGRYIKRSGVADKGACHILRHSTATHMLNNGASIRYIQELLGHADLSTTQEYTHVTISGLKKEHQKTHPFAQND